MYYIVVDSSIRGLASTVIGKYYYHMTDNIIFNSLARRCWRSRLAMELISIC